MICVDRVNKTFVNGSDCYPDHKLESLYNIAGRRVKELVNFFTNYLFVPKSAQNGGSHG